MNRCFLPLEEKAEKGRRKEPSREKQGLWVSITLEIHDVGNGLPNVVQITQL